MAHPILSARVQAPPAISVVELQHHYSADRQAVKHGAPGRRDDLAKTRQSFRQLGVPLAVGGEFVALLFHHRLWRLGREALPCQQLP